MNQLRSIREKKGLTIAQLAARASIPARVLVEYEEGRQPLPLTHAKLLAKALWVNIEDLLPPAGASPDPSAPSAPAAAQSPQHTQQRQIPAQTAFTPIVRVPPTPSTSTSASAPSATSAPASSSPAPSPPPARTPRGEAAGPAVDRGELAPHHRETETARPKPDSGARKAQPHVQTGTAQIGARQPRNPPHTLTEGQLQEILRLAAHLGVGQEQLEQRLGKSLESLLRSEAREWIKRLRDMAEELAPSPRIKFGHWPQAQEDLEAAYLKQQKEAAAPFTFKLFNGEQYNGVITDFTPYTITIKPFDAGEEIVLRKLAIAYYRRMPTPGGEG